MVVLTVFSKAITSFIRQLISLSIARLLKLLNTIAVKCIAWFNGILGNNNGKMNNSILVMRTILSLSILIVEHCV